MMSIRFIALCGASALFGNLAIAAPQTPISDFVEHASYGTARISPDGRYMAITVDRGDQDVLIVMQTDDLKIRKINQLPDKKSVGDFHWVSPDRLMFNAVRKMGGYAQPFPTGEWFAVDADGSRPRPLIFYGTRDATQRGKSVGMQSFTLLDTLKDNDEEVIMQVFSPRSSEGAGTEIVRMNTVSGRRTSLGRAPKENCRLILDAQKQPGFAVCTSSKDEEGEYDERTELYRREGQSWTLVNASKSAGKHLSVVRTSDNGTVFAEEDDGALPPAVGTLNTTTGEFKPLFQDKVAEISRMIWSTDQNNLIAVVTEAGAPLVSLVDENSPDAELYTSLASAFENQMVDFSSYTQDGKKIVVSVYSDTNPGGALFVRPGYG